EAGSETVGSMPLIREIGGLQIDPDGNPQLTVQGDTLMNVALDGVWHFDKAYSPLVRNVRLVWSYNSFPMFFTDLLAKLRGAQTPTGEKPRDIYGLSFVRRG